MYGILPDTSGISISTEYIDSCKLATWWGEETITATTVQKLLRINISKGDRKTSIYELPENYDPYFNTIKNMAGPNIK